MLSKVVLALSILPLTLAQSNETVLGAYLFHRHGDRTPKALAPANLTTLGYQEVYTSGQWFRNRYIAPNATYKVQGMSSDIVNEGQISVSAPLDNVLQNSAMGFVQGLYPPVGSSESTSALRNGTKVSAPMDGYQLIPVEIVSTGSGSEDNSWLQSASGCGAATISSNNYFLSSQYNDLLRSTSGFYSDLTPVINGTFNSSQISFKNAYTSTSPRSFSCLAVKLIDAQSSISSMSPRSITPQSTAPMSLRLTLSSKSARSPTRTNGALPTTLPTTFAQLLE